MRSGAESAGLGNLRCVASDRLKTLENKPVEAVSEITGVRTRTGDLRIMRPPTPSRNPKAGTALGSHKQSLVVNPRPDTAEMPAELTEVIDGWSTLPEAIRAGILAMVRASRNPSG
jgi:hypothetical protein